MDTEQCAKELFQMLQKIKQYTSKNIKFDALSRNEVMVAIIIFQLREENGKDYSITIKKIHEESYITKPALSVVISKLEKKGFIERYYDRANLRTTCVKLTKYSESYIENCGNQVISKLIKIIEKMGLEQTKKLIEQNQLFLNAINELYEEEKNVKVS